MIYEKKASPEIETLFPIPLTGTSGRGFDLVRFFGNCGLKSVPKKLQLLNFIGTKACNPTNFDYIIAEHFHSGSGLNKAFVNGSF